MSKDSPLILSGKTLAVAFSFFLDDQIRLGAFKDRKTLLKHFGWHNRKINDMRSGNGRLMDAHLLKVVEYFKVEDPYFLLNYPPFSVPILKEETNLLNEPREDYGKPAHTKSLYQLVEENNRILKEIQSDTRKK